MIDADDDDDDDDDDVGALDCDKGNFGFDLRSASVAVRNLCFGLNKTNFSLEQKSIDDSP